jgi:broad specificity phosphatase PhoE
MEPLSTALAHSIQTHEGLLDVDYGRFSGLTHSEAAETYPELYRLWRAAPGQVRFPDGESLGHLRDRLLSLLDQLAVHHQGQTVALVGHQIVNKVAVCSLLGLDLDHIWRIRQDTCGFDLFKHAGGDWHVLRLNDTCHLASGGWQMADGR